MLSALPLNNFLTDPAKCLARVPQTFRETRETSRETKKS